MVRISKQQERRNISPKRPRPPGKKTGPRKENLPQGFKVHGNAVPAEMAQAVFIPKIK